MPWTPYSTSGGAGADLRDDVVTYGPDIADESDIKLLGNVEGKRILDFGCGTGANAVALARHGARSIALDDVAEDLQAARARAEAAEVKVEIHESPLAELAFLRADTVDACLAVYSLVRVDDLGRAFRQIHRVLRTNAPFVLSLPHPTFRLLDPHSPDPLRVRHSAFADGTYPPLDPRHGTTTRTFAQLFTALRLAGFSVDNVVEPPPSADPVRSEHWSPAMESVPATLILRARKEGI